MLDDLRVIELSAFVAAPLGGMTLAQLGADVIRIDPLKGGLDYRRWPVTEENTSLFWCGLNKEKKSVTIDIASPRGKELVKALILTPANSDIDNILLTNFPPSPLLDYDALSQERPGIIKLSITGDRHGRSAVDYTVNPTLGLPLLTGPEESEAACNQILPAWDLITGHMAVIGILAAERQRSRTGKGQHIQLALEDAALAMMGHLGFIAEAQLGQDRERYGNYLYGAFGRDFLSADAKRIMIVGLTAKQWSGLVRATQLQADFDKLAEDAGHTLDDEANRFKSRKEIALLIEKWCRTHTLVQIQERFDANGVCWSVYQTIRERVQATGKNSIEDNPLFSYVLQRGVGEYLTPGLPLVFSGMPDSATRPAPALGEHTEEVLSDTLGLTIAQIGKLIDDRIVGRA